MTASQYRRLRVRVGSQSQVARLLGVHSRTISKRETGELAVNTEAALAIRFLHNQHRQDQRRPGP